MGQNHPFDPRSDDRYKSLPPELIPESESLRDVIDRLVPYWYDHIVVDLRAARVVLVSAHGNTIRGLCKHLDDLSDRDIETLEIPTGIPPLYELGSNMRPAEAMETLDRLLQPATH